MDEADPKLHAINPFHGMRGFRRILTSSGSVISKEKKSTRRSSLPMDFHPFKPSDGIFHMIESHWRWAIRILNRFECLMTQRG